MSQQELLKKIVRIFDAIHVDYMVSGSIASSLQGEPRSTHDIDVVVDLTEDKIPGLLAAFPFPDYYLEKENVLEALREQGTFNVIASEDGDKIDFWILTDDPYDQSRFSRRISEEVMGMRLNVSSPEDTILMKLKWAMLSGGSDKQSTDALRVYEVQYGKLDLEYIEKWARILRVGELWKGLKERAEIA